MTELSGHGINSLALEVTLAFVAVVLLLLFLHAQDRRNKIRTFVWGCLFFFFMPNAAYLGVEIRHALVIDNIADGSDIIGKAFFVFLGLLGFLLATGITLTAATEVSFLKRKVTVSIVLLSFLSAFGSTLGVMGLTSIEGLRSFPKIVEFSVDIVTSWERMTFVIVLSIFLILFGLFGKRMQESLN